MKRYVLPFLALAISAQSFAQTIDTVTLGAGITKQVYYSLIDGVETSADNSDWEIAFQTSSQFSASILINPANGTELYMYPGDTSDWSTLDTAGMSSWTQLHNSDTSWDYGAFSPPSSFPDYGWGRYNSVTHHVVGHKLFVIKLGNGAYQKIWIRNLISGTYTFRHATLDNAMDMTHSLSANNYSGKNFAYFSLQAHSAKDKEPLSSEWDLYFGKYTAFVPTAYPVTGVLLNVNTEGAKAYPVNDPTTYMDWGSHPLKSQINAIGYDWKSFNMTSMQYEIADSTVYFVRNQEGDVFKLLFKHYGGSTTGDIVFEKTQVHYSGVQENKESKIFGLYPNPTRDVLNVALQSSKDGLFEIFNTNGEKVAGGRLSANQLIQTLDVSSLNEGVYIFSFTTDNERFNKRFIIQH